MSLTHELRSGARIALTTQIAVLSGGIVAATLLSSFITLAVPSDGATEPVPLPSPGMVAATTGVFVAPVVMSLLIPHGDGFAARVPPFPAAARFIAAAALTWLAMGAVGVANPWLRYLFGLPQFEGLGVSDRQMVLLAFQAGISEEAAYLAIPAGLAWLIGCVVNRCREKHGRAPCSRATLWAISATVGPAVVLVGRASGHLYQGGMSAVLGVAWGAALIAIFVWVRTVWPLMLGHVVYDLPTSYPTWSGLIAHHVIAPAVIAVVALALIQRAKHRTKRESAGYAARP